MRSRRRAVLPATLLLLAGLAGCAAGASQPASGRQPGAAASADPSREPAVRGVVTAVTDASVSVRTESGAVQTFRFGLNTRIRRAGADASVADVHVGDPVSLFGGAGAGTVRRIVIRGGSLPASPSAGPGD